MGIPYTVGTDTFYYFLLRALAPLGGELISKTMLVAVFSLAGFSMYLLCATLGVSRWISWASGLFYMLSPFTYLELTAGHIPSVVSYALAPVYLFFFVRALRRPDIKNLLLSGISLAIAWTYIDFVVILTILSLGLGLAFSVPTRRKLLTLSGSYAQALAVHSFWILPIIGDLASRSIVLRTPGEASRLYIRLSVVYGSSSPLIDTFRLKTFFIGNDPQFWPHFWTGQNTWIFFSFLVPIFAFSSLLLSRKGTTIALASVGLMGVVLTSGVTLLGPVYSWLILNVPYFDIFTAVHRWLPLALIPYSILIGITFDELAKRISVPLGRFSQLRFVFSANRIHSGIATSIRVTRSSKNKKRQLGLALSLIILLSTTLAASGSFFMLPPRLLDSRLHTYAFNEGEQGIYQTISQANGDFRVANFPLLGDLGVPGSADAGADPLGVYPPKPAIEFGQGFSSISDAAAYTRFLSLTSYLRTTNDIGKLLGLTGVKYIIYYHNRSDQIHDVLYSPWYPSTQTNSLDSFFSSQKNLTKIVDNRNITVYEIPNYMPHIYASNQMDLVTGDRSALLELLKLNNYNFSQTAVVFAKQLPPDIIASAVGLSSHVVFVDNTFMDLVGSFIPSQFVVNPGFYSTQSDWLSIDSEWWGKYRFSSSLNFGDGLFTRNPNDQVSIYYNAPQSGEYEIWADLYKDPSSFSTSFAVDGNHLADAVTYSPVDAGFNWTYVGSMVMDEGQHKIDVRNSSVGTSSILQLLVVPRDFLLSVENSLTTAIQHKPLTFLLKPLPTTEDLFNSTQLLGNVYFISGADRTSSKLNYSYAFQNQIFELATTFTQTGTVNEAILGHVDVVSTPLAQVQTLQLVIRLSDPSLQFFEIKLVLSAGDGSPDQIIPALDTPNNLPQNVFSELDLNIATLAQRLSIDPQKMKLVGLQLVFQKTSGTDLSSHPARVTFDISQMKILRNKQQIDIEASFGNAAISDASTSLFVPTTGSYRLTARIKANANANLILSIDSTITLHANVTAGMGYQWVDFGVVTLATGSHHLSLDSPKIVNIDLMVVETDGSGEATLLQPNLAYQGIDPTKYAVRTANTQPFFLVFMENYDPQWTLSIGNIVHYRAFAIGNLYFIPKPVPEFLIFYTRQSLFSIGLIVSGATWALSIVGLMAPVALIRKIKFRNRVFAKKQSPGLTP